MNDWLKIFTAKVQDAFASRIQCIGIQGSYGRGEATEASDIDMVVILDTLSYADIQTYDRLLSTMAHREKICGFISGYQELLHWERSDLFQFYHDTIPLVGSLDWLQPLIGPEDIRQAIHAGACNIYHQCVHNALHEKSMDVLYFMYKSSFFILQAKHFCASGTYIRRKADLLPLLGGMDAQVLHQGMKDAPPLTFGESSRLLLEWSSSLIREWDR